jgi:metal-responsive CopG/Arc/MetJ family transcriptional regulator
MTQKTRTTAVITVALDAALVERLDRWLATHDDTLSRPDAIETAIREFLDKRDSKMKREYPE